MINNHLFQSLYICLPPFISVDSHMHISYKRLSKERKAMHILKHFSMHERENEREQDTYITQMRASHYWALALFVQAAFSWHLVRDVHDR